MVENPTADPVQIFCVDPQNPPTVASLVASGQNNWYISESSLSPLPPNTPLINNQTYYATTVSPPCESTFRVAVTVELYEQNNSGAFTAVNYCETDIVNGNIVNLLSLLNGNPSPNGQWSGPIPIINGSLGTIDLGNLSFNGAPYTFTYTVSDNLVCPPSETNLVINIFEIPDAGLNNSITICSNDTPFDLFNTILGNPSPGGVWIPALSSGTNIFNPELDTAGVYTYTFQGVNPCPTVSSQITVNINQAPNAGVDNVVSICIQEPTVDLRTLLNGTPDSNGVWEPALTGGNFFNPSLDTPGIYTYTVSGASPCGDSSAQLTISIDTIVNAGINNSIAVCSDSAPFSLFGLLGADAMSGGFWTPELSSGTSIFNPAIDQPGDYTYTIVSNNNCPDASAVISVQITQTPNAGQNAQIILCETDPVLDLFTLLGADAQQGGIWTPALASGTGEFNPQLDASGVYVYTIQGQAPCVDAQVFVSVTVEEAPNPGIGGTFTFCSNDAPISLTSLLGGSPQIGGVWSPALASGNDVFNPQIDLPGTYTYTVISQNGCNSASSDIVINIQEIADPGINSTIELCITDAAVDLFIVLNGTPQPGGVWTPALPNGLFDPQVNMSGVYTYTISGNAPCSDVSATVTVTILPAPDAGVSSSVSVCSFDAPVDLFALLGPNAQPGGTWTPALSGDSFFNPQLDVAGNYTYTVSSPNGCGTSSAVVSVQLTNEANAGESSSITVCSSEAAFNLLNSLGGTPQAGGIWSPALVNGVFNPQVNNSGVYTYTVSNACGSATASVTVSVVQQSDAGLNANISICTNAAPISLFDALGGTPQVDGTWSPALPNGIFNPQLNAAGVYTYTVSGNAPCADVSASVTVTLLPLPNAGDSASISICILDAPVDLFPLLGSNAQVGGIWTPSLSGGSVFNPQVDAAGNYMYTVTSPDGCGVSTAVVSVQLTTEANAGQNASISVCSSDAPFNLFGSLGGTPQVGGTWSPALPNGIFNPQLNAAGVYTYTVTNACGTDAASVTVDVILQANPGTNANLTLCSDSPAVSLFNVLGGNPQLGGVWTPSLPNGIFDPQLNSAGVYTYTVSGNSPCADASATVTVTILTSPNAGLDASINICSSDAPFSLFSLLGGSPETGGIWSPALENGIFNPQLNVSGIYTYTITNACGSSSANITVNVSQQPDAGLNGQVSLCSDAAPISLVNFLNGTPQPGGVWTPALPNGLFDPQVNMSGVYTYTISGNAPCSDVSATVTVTILPAPDAGVSSSVSVCSFDAPVDLFALLGPNAQPGGTWTPALSGDSFFNPQLDVAGNYTYTVSSPNGCGTSSAVVSVQLTNEANAGESSSITVCSSEAAFNLLNSLGGTPQAGGIWSPALVNGVFNPQVNNSGVYTYTVSNACGSATASVTVSVVQQSDAGLNANISICTNAAPISLFDALGGTPQVDGTWSPALPNGIFNPQLNAAGVYTYTVSGNAPCADVSASVTVTLLPLPNAGDSASISICILDAPVDLFPLLGSNAQVGGIWTPSLSGGSVFNPQVDAAGNYMYTVTSPDGCGVSTAVVSVQLTTEANAGQNASISVCSSDAPFNLFGSLGGTPQVGGTWSPSLPNGIFNPQLNAAGVYTYTVTNACGTDAASVTVSIQNPANSGTSSTINICPNSTPLNLFTFLGPGTQTGGFWTPALASGTNIYSPSADGPGVFTYTVGGSGACPPSQSTVTVNFLTLPTAGNFTGLQQICQSTAIFDLFTLLDGSQTPGGIWVNSSGNIIPSSITPPLFAPGLYSFVYLVSNPCQSSSIIVQLEIIGLPNLTQEQLSIDSPVCENQEATIHINGLPNGDYELVINASGTNTFSEQTLSFTSNSGSASVNIDSFLLTQIGVTNIQLVSITSLPLGCTRIINLNFSFEIVSTPDLSNTTFSIEDICLSDFIELTSNSVGPMNNGNFGINYQINQNGTTVFQNTAVIEIVNGQLQWSLNDNSWQQMGMFEFVITSITDLSTSCSNATNVIVPFEILTSPDDLNISMTVVNAEICLGDIQTLNFDLVAPSTISLNALITVSGVTSGSENVVLSFVEGVASFPLSTVFDEVGMVTISVLVLDNIQNDCGTASYLVQDITFEVTQPQTPILTAGGNEFCASDAPTLEDLSVNLITDHSIIWFADADLTQSLPPSTSLVDGQTYYALAQSSIGCISETALPITVVVVSVEMPVRVDFDLFCGNDNATLSDLSLQLNTHNATLLWFATSSSTEPLDINTLLQNGVTYFAQTQDLNGCLSERLAVEVVVEDIPTPLLTAPPTELCQQDAPTISVLESFINSQGFDLLWYDSLNSVNALPLNSLLVSGTTLFVEAVSASGCTSSRLAVSVVLENCIDDVVIPDGFSPNADGINDTFEILFLRELYPNFVLEIYNRFGTMVYKGNFNTPDWDGTTNQRGVRLEKGQLPVGVYFFVLEFNDGERKPIQGRVYLNR